jgi:tetratricopeptide (TPR) repeat protein
MKFLKNKRTRWLVVGLIAGLIALTGGLTFATWKNTQVSYYDAGISAYQHGHMQSAVVLFDESLSAYHQDLNRDWFEQAVYPAANRELAALADFQKGEALLQMKQDAAAVQAWEESLQLNPGNGPSYASLSPSDANRMHEEALVVKYNLEKLLLNNPKLVQVQGNG